MTRSPGKTQISFLSVVCEKERSPSAYTWFTYDSLAPQAPITWETHYQITQTSQISTQIPPSITFRSSSWAAAKKLKATMDRRSPWLHGEAPTSCAIQPCVLWTAPTARVGAQWPPRYPLGVSKQCVQRTLDDPESAPDHPGKYPRCFIMTPKLWRRQPEGYGDS